MAIDYDGTFEGGGGGDYGSTAEAMAALRRDSQATRENLEEIDTAGLTEGLRQADTAAREFAATSALINYTFNKIGNVIVDSIGDGIAEQLIEGTHDWERALKNVLKQIVAIIAKLIVAQTINQALGGSVSSGGGVSVSLIKLHEGGSVGAWPRHHDGVLARDEHPAILQRGEFVVRRDAVRAMGAERLEAINRGESLGGNVTIAPVIHVTTSSENPRALAERIAEPLIDILNREARRGRAVGVA
jgi:lambda family phage tail tape measure protein